MSDRLPEARLADSLALVAPALPEELVSREALANLTELARTLPPVHVAGFECRLAAGDGAVDLQQSVLARGDARVAMERSLDATGGLSPAWERVRRLCADWPDEVTELWLEFDPEPSVFIVLAHDGDARAVFPKLVDEASGPVLDRFVEAADPPARVSHLGAMLGRPGAGLRIHVADVALESLGSFLRDVGWPGDVAGAIDAGRLLLDHGDQGVLCFDALDGELLPRLGLECFFAQKQRIDPRWRPLLAKLVDLGLSAPAKADALLRWPGAVTPLDAPAPWPDDLVVASLSQPADSLGIVERRLSHVKLTLAPNAPVAAKAYFGFGHVWAPQRSTADPRSIPTVAPAASVDDAIERAVAFLLRARNQAGWWRDFFDRGRPRDADRRVTGYASDEWVTAYVANAMAAAPRPEARVAARSAFELLMRRRDTGGWGYHALLPPDADTTTWVLRLAETLGAPKSPRLDDARAFVSGLTSPSGAVATYEPASVPQLREFLAMDGTYDGWCAEHTCVTAAAAAFGDNAMLAHLAAAQRPDGSWTGHWWDDDEYTTARAIEALAPHPQYADAVARGVAWAYTRTDGSPFATALAIHAVAAGAGSPQPQAIESLLDAQREDGSWEPSARLRVPGPDETDPLASPQATLTYVDDDALFTSATVLWALSSVVSRA